MDYPPDGDKKDKERKEVQGNIQKKKVARKKWDSNGDEESRQEYWGDSHTTKIEVAKEKVYNEFYVRLDIKEG